MSTIAEARRKRLSAEQLADRLLETVREHDRRNARERMKRLRAERRERVSA